jgi:hypothetical protein
MCSTRFQLLVTLAATLVSAGFFAARGLPPTSDLENSTDIVQMR